MSYEPESIRTDAAADWRGKQRAREAAPSRGWQQGGGVHPLTQLRIRQQWWRIRVAVFLLIALAFLAAWGYFLLFSAVQTPVVAVTAVDYDWPLPPNAWAQEDVEGLADLDRSTLRLQRLAAPRRSRQAIDEFLRQLVGTSASSPRGTPLLIYVSMHGAVNAAGEPCLVPPGASPYDSAGWVPLGELLTQIKTRGLPPDVTWLLLLDCNRMPSNWSLGLLYNGFADRLEETVREAGIPQLVVLNSAGPGQVAWASPQLSGSSFGHYLRRGLAGAADANQNGRITIRELHTYLRREVNAWALAHRGTPQEPLLIEPPGSGETNVSWVPRVAVLPSAASSPSISLDELRDLWTAHDQLLAAQPLRFDPLGFQDFEHRLMWLEQGATSGRGYEQKTNETRDQLKRTVAGWQRAFQHPSPAASGSVPVANRRRIWTDQAQAPPRPWFHTLPLASFEGLVDSGQADLVGEQWNRWMAAPNAAMLAEVLNQLDSVTQRERLPLLTESVFLKHAQRLLAVDVAKSSPNEALAAVFASVILGEQVAVPDDERAFAWVRSAVDAGDQLRREAEDALMSGDTASAVSASRQADDAYRRAQELSALVASSLELHDRTWAELPHLAQWITRPPPAGPSSLPPSQKITTRLRRLIDNLHRLGAQLAAPPERASVSLDDEATLAKAREEVAADRAWLRQLFDQQVEELSQARRATARQMPALQAVLATPLLPAERRLALWEQLARWEAALAQSGIAQAEEPAAEGLGAAAQEAAVARGGAAVVDGLAWWDAHWPEHPAVEMLRLPPLPATAAVTGGAQIAEETAAPGATSNTAESVEPDPARRLAADGERIRRVLSELPRRWQASGEAAPSGAIDTPERRADRAKLLAQTERLVRSTAAFRLPPQDVDPIAQRSRRDRQRLLLWHARRTMDDFRGPVEVGEPSFFELATRDCLDGLELLAGTSPDFADERGQCESLLAARRRLARQGLSLAVENRLLVEPADAVRARVAIKPGAEGAAAALPAGRAALLVRSGGRGVAEATFAQPGETGGATSAVAFPLTEPMELELQAPPLSLSGTDLTAVAAFRGHEFSTPFLVQSISGVTIDFVPRTDDTTRVTLKGGRRQRRSIVFILDCSDSMKELSPVEATSGNRLPRLDLAKSALQGMLDQLATDRDSRVGVRFFGHRVGWSTTESVRLLRQNAYTRPIPLDVAPSEDVELVLPLGRFDSVIAGQIEDLMRSVKPWGQTPLYRALVEAMSDFDLDEPDTDKHIVVITDGVNYQFTPSANGQFPPPRPTELNDVVSAWGKQKPAFHIVGFGIPANESAEAERAYRRLIERTRGSYDTTAVEAQALLRQLDEVLAHSTFQIRDSHDRDVGAAFDRDGGLSDAAGPARLGETLVLQTAPQTRQSYTVSCGDASQEILLRGGESVELELSEDGRQITSAAYLAGSPRFSPLRNTGSGTESGYVVGIHRPIVQMEGVQFTLSMQHERRQFTPRPAEVWMEIQPLRDDGTPFPATYTFYDPEFVPEVPVPALQWLARGWPADAPAARVNFWCKPETTTGDVVIPLEEVPQSPATRREFASFPGVSFQIETTGQSGEFGVRLVEWHGTESPGPGSLKVELVGPTSVPRGLARVVRIFDSEHGVAAHLFTLARADQTQFRGWQIRLTGAPAVRASALQLDQPIDVPIAEGVDLLPPPRRP